MVEGYGTWIVWAELVFWDRPWIPSESVKSSASSPLDTHTHRHTVRPCSHHYSPWFRFIKSVHNRNYKHLIFLWTCGALKVTIMHLCVGHLCQHQNLSYISSLSYCQDNQSFCCSSPLTPDWLAAPEKKNYLSDQFSAVPNMNVSLYLSISPILWVCPWNRV